MNRNEIKLLFLIAVIFLAACIETDIYLPAFPDMMRFFSVTESEIQKLLSWNFLGICLVGPFYGPLSDSFGRKRPLIIALALFFAGSLLTLFAVNYQQMLWGRVLQGVGSGGIFTLGIAIIFDAFSHEKAIQANNHLSMTIPCIMAAAPLCGAYLNHTYGFRSNFLLIALFVFASLAVSLFFFKETLPQEKRTPFKGKSLLRDFKRAFSNVAFWQLTILMSISFSGYIAFLSATAVLFVVELGVSKAIFPFYQAAILGGWVAGSLSLSKGIARWGESIVKRSGIALFLLGGLLLGVFTLFVPKSPFWLTFAMVFYSFGSNWMLSLYFPESMELLPENKGLAASLMTSARLLVASCIVGFVGWLYNATIYPLSATIVAIVALSFPLIFFYESASARKKQQLPPEPTSSLE